MDLNIISIKTKPSLFVYIQRCPCLYCCVAVAHSMHCPGGHAWHWMAATGDCWTTCWGTRVGGQYQELLSGCIIGLNLGYLRYSATYDIYDTPTSALAASSNDPETLSSMESILGHPTWIDLPIEMAATDIACQLALVYFGRTVLQVPNLTGRNGRPANDIDVMTPVVIFACWFQNLEEALLWRHRRQVSAYPP